MKTTVNEFSFNEAFHKAGRSAQFSSEGLDALYDYLTELEEATGEDMELDVIAICCDFTEYDSVREAYDAYWNDYEDRDDEERDDETKLAHALEQLENNTQVIKVEGTERIIIANF